MSLLKTEIRAELHGPDGKLIRRYPWKRANSLLKQFIQMLTVQMSTTAINTLDTGNITRSLIASTSNFNTNAGIGITTRGILIGTGIDAVTMVDYKLQTQVTTNIDHSASIFAVEDPSSSICRLAITRGFLNNTGSTLEIKEAALYTYGAGTSWFFCLDRTLYSVSVPNGVTLTLTYRITVTL